MPFDVNCGVVGAEMHDIRDYAAEMVEKYNPRMVVLVGGENDFLASRPPREIVGLLRETVRTISHESLRQNAGSPLSRSGPVPIVFFGTKREPSTDAFHPFYEEYDVLCQKLADEEFPNLTFVKSDEIEDRSLFRWDGLHMNKDGYALWNRKLVPIALDKLAPDSREDFLNETFPGKSQIHESDNGYDQPPPPTVTTIREWSEYRAARAI